MIGTCYLHTVIDDHSRVAYVEARDDESKETTTDVLKNAVAWFAERGITVKRVLSERQLLQVEPLEGDLQRPGHHTGEDTALPPTDERKDRALPPHPGRRLGLQEVPQLRVSPTRGSASMGPRVQPPPAPLSDREGRAHHQVGQPGWASQLDDSVRTGVWPDSVQVIGGQLSMRLPTGCSGVAHCRSAARRSP